MRALSTAATLTLALGISTGKAQNTPTAVGNTRLTIVQARMMATR